MHVFPMIIRFIDTGKIKQIFSLEQLSKHQGQPIIVVSHSLSKQPYDL